VVPDPFSKVSDIFLEARKEVREKTPEEHVFKPIITAKTTPKAVSTADSADEAVTGAYGYPGRADQGGAGGKSGAGSDGRP
jgi:hypothetical protein